MDWRPYPNDRLIAQHPSGEFYIIKPVKGMTRVVPIFCPMCATMMKSFYDESAFDKFRCCDKCASAWVYPDLDRWKSGWRPSEEDVKDRISLSKMNNEPI